MDFPLLELHGWDKRPAIQPKTIDSEVPYLIRPACGGKCGIMRVRRGGGDFTPC